MAISKTFRFALKALSQSNTNVTRTYKLKREINNFKSPSLLKLKYRCWHHIIYANKREIPIKIFYPALASQTPEQILIFYHGGGWSTGDGNSYDNVCLTMAENTNSIVVFVDYRLAPEHKFPIGLEDCYAATKEIFINAQALNINQDDIILIGDSAGGNISAVVSLMARDRAEFSPKRQILLYPATNNDHTLNSPFKSISTNGSDFILTSKRMCEYVELYLDNADDFQNPYFAPLLAENLKKQPDTLIITASLDPLCDEGEEYGKKLSENENKVTIHRINDAVHGFLSVPFLHSSISECYEIINNFLKGVVED